MQIKHDNFIPSKRIMAKRRVLPKRRLGFHFSYRNTVFNTDNCLKKIQTSYNGTLGPTLSCMFTVKTKTTDTF